LIKKQPEEQLQSFLLPIFEHFLLIQVLRFAMPGMTKKNRKKYDYF